MVKLFRRTLNIIAVVIMLFAMNIVAFAAGTTTIDISNKAPGVGNSVTVTVKATESGTITVKYTSSLLKYSSCSVGGATTSGNTVSFSGKEGDIVFETAANGTASIIVSSNNNEGSSATLAIGQATQAEEPKPQEQPKEEPAQEPAAPETTEEPAADDAAPAEVISAPVDGSTVGTLTPEGKFDIGGVIYVASERYKDNEVPAGFSSQSIKIGSSTYSEPSNGAITLVYLKPADNTSGSGVFYVFNQEAGTVSPFLMVGNAEKYVIISESSDAPGAGFNAATVEVTGGTAPAYTIDGAEFFYVYGNNQDGAEGWYVYDKTYDTVSRLDQSALSSLAVTGEISDSGEPPKEDNDSYSKKLDLYRKIIMGLIVLAVILLFVIINRAAKGRGDDFDGDVFAKLPPAKSPKRVPRSIVFKNKFDEEYDDEEDDEDDEDFEEDDEDFDDEDDYYDDEDDESQSSNEYDSYEARRDSSLNMMDLNDL